LLAILDDIWESVHWWIIEYHEDGLYDALDDRAPFKAILTFAWNSIF